jgi:hypothetical protein
MRAARKKNKARESPYHFVGLWVVRILVRVPLLRLLVVALSSPSSLSLSAASRDSRGKEKEEQTFLISIWLADFSTPRIS